MTTATLPYPVSANRYWRTFGNMVVVSAEAKAYKKAAALIGAAAGMRPTEKQCSVSLVLHPKLTKKGAASLVCLDLDNVCKVTLDAMTGVAYHDDKQVRKLAAEYGEPVLDGALSIRIEELP